MNKLSKLFKKKLKPFIIGMIHLGPMSGYAGYPGLDRLKEKMSADLEALEKGGVDGVMIENNYDVPHYEKVLMSTIQDFEYLCELLREKTKLPLGISLLWNDYENALRIAKKYNFQFVRVPVFVDRVKTEYGVFEPKAKECLEYRKQIAADEVLILADIQVKHAEHLIKRPIAEAAAEAEEKGADALIVTGKWTGDAPTVQDVSEVKSVAGELPVLLGSGITPDNVHDYDVDGVIVGTYFKSEVNRGQHEQNLFPWETSYELEKIMKLVQARGKL
ncbi:TPA: hypothetical protein DF272_04025 [Candidatus Falkowbacteria bacterium]|nr:hypothetical protein [Candidatus Falkowbacteria bacterium]